jgi:hypothetical protein
LTIRLTQQALFHKPQLFHILANEANSDVIGWLPHGKAFIIHNQKMFTAEILPKFFKQSKFTSFTRKLKRWGFSRVKYGPEMGAYYHKFFQKDNMDLMQMQTCQSTSIKKANPQLPIPPAVEAGSIQTPFGSNNNFSSSSDDAFQLNPPFLGAAGGGAGSGDIVVGPQNQCLLHHQLRHLQMQQLQLQQLQLQQLYMQQMQKQQQQQIQPVEQEQELMRLPGACHQQEPDF